MTTRLSRALTVLALLGAAGTVSPAHAQLPVPAQPQLEARLDAALSPRAGILGGVGVNVRAGWYTRLGLQAVAGVERRGERWTGWQRVDATARFLFDPFGERAHGLYGGAGLGLRRELGGAVEGQLLLLVGLEGAPVGRVVPAAELTLGGGVRAGVVLRGRRKVGR